MTVLNELITKSWSCKAVIKVAADSVGVNNPGHMALLSLASAPPAVRKFWNTRQSA